MDFNLHTSECDTLVEATKHSPWTGFSLAIHLKLFYGLPLHFHYRPWVASRRPFNHNVHHLILQCTQAMLFHHNYTAIHITFKNYTYSGLIWDANCWDILAPSHFPPSLTLYDRGCCSSSCIWQWLRSRQSICIDLGPLWDHSPFCPGSTVTCI